MISVLFGRIRWQVMKIRIPLDKDVRWMNVILALVCGLSGSCVVCLVLMRSASCRYPVSSRNVLSICYMVHIRFVRYTSFTCTLVDRSLSVTCPVRMRSLLLPRPSPPRRLPPLDKHFFTLFCSFGDRYLDWLHYCLRICPTNLRCTCMCV